MAKANPKVEEVTPLPVQHKNTTVGKTVRTALQTFAGAVSVAIPVLVASEDFRNYLNSNPEWAWLVFALPAAASFFTFLQNAADPTVPNTVNDKV